MAGDALSRQADQVSATAECFLLMTLVAESVLIFITWPLWTQVSPFPAVPLFSFLSAVPVAVDRCFLALLLTAILVLSIELATGRSLFRFPKKATLATSLVAAIVLAALNQHRLQPWHWLFILVAAQTLCLRPTCGLQLHRLTIASIYVFAAVSRLGPGVADGMSREVVTVVCRGLSLAHLLRDEDVVFRLCVGMSLVELTCGLLLLIPRTRLLGVCLTVALHITLLVVLSPLGLKHHYGVLAWNVYFLIAVPVLFWPTGGKSVAAERTKTTRELTKPAWMFAAFVLGFPASGLVGIADNWLSWQLYSPRPEVLRVFVRQQAAQDLPAAVRQYVGQPAPLDDWCPVRIDRWSLAAVNAPIYPEDRFQMAVAGYLALSVDKSAIQVQMDAPATPSWWNRDRRAISGEEITAAQSGFVLNGTAVRELPGPMR